MNARRDELLRLIVEDYIKLAKPVSSASLCESLNCSSATVRSEMATLEELGYLEKEHISSGRIPSEKGYRYYVDYLMQPKKMTGEDMLKLQTILNNNELELNDTILESLKLVSEITNYTSLVLGSASSENVLKQLEIIPLNESKLVAIVITDKGHVEHKNVSLPTNVSIEEVRKTVELINKMLIGTKIDEISEKLEFEIKPIIGKHVKQHQVLYDAFYNVFQTFVNKNNTYFAGRNNMLRQPEFSNVEKIRNLLEKFEDREIINNISPNDDEDSDDGNIKIYIGNESDIDSDVALIKTKISFDGEENTIAIVGPKRMEYDRVVAILEYLKEKIERK